MSVGMALNYRTASGSDRMPPFNPGVAQVCVAQLLRFEVEWRHPNRYRSRFCIETFVPDQFEFSVPT
jgi:hypothetical protein